VNVPDEYTVCPGCGAVLGRSKWPEAPKYNASPECAEVAGELPGYEETALITWAREVWEAWPADVHDVIRVLTIELVPSRYFRRWETSRFRAFCTPVRVGTNHRRVEPETVLLLGFRNLRPGKKFGADGRLALRFRPRSHRMTQVASLPWRDHSDAVL